MTTVAAGTYTVKVTAKNAVGESARSDASSSVTIAGAALLENNPTISPSTIGDLFVDDLFLDIDYKSVSPI
jgi:PKD repeat protein